MEKEKEEREERKKEKSPIDIESNRSNELTFNRTQPCSNNFSISPVRAVHYPFNLNE